MESRFARAAHAYVFKANGTLRSAVDSVVEQYPLTRPTLHSLLEEAQRLLQGPLVKGTKWRRMLAQKNGRKKDNASALNCIAKDVPELRDPLLHVMSAALPLEQECSPRDWNALFDRMDEAMYDAEGDADPQTHEQLRYLRQADRSIHVAYNTGQLPIRDEQVNGENTAIVVAGPWMGLCVEDSDAAEQLLLPTSGGRLLRLCSSSAPHEIRDLLEDMIGIVETRVQHQLRLNVDNLRVGLQGHNVTGPAEENESEPLSDVDSENLLGSDEEESGDGESEDDDSDSDDANDLRDFLTTDDSNDEDGVSPDTRAYVERHYGI
jgi:hypothetical protein